MHFPHYTCVSFLLLFQLAKNVPMFMMFSGFFLFQNWSLGWLWLCYLAFLHTSCSCASDTRTITMTMKRFAPCWTILWTASKESSRSDMKTWTQQFCGCPMSWGCCTTSSSIQETKLSKQRTLSSRTNSLSKTLTSLSTDKCYQTLLCGSTM